MGWSPVLQSGNQTGSIPVFSTKFDAVLADSSNDPGTRLSLVRSPSTKSNTREGVHFPAGSGD